MTHTSWRKNMVKERVIKHPIYLSFELHMQMEALDLLENKDLHRGLAQLMAKQQFSADATWRLFYSTLLKQDALTLTFSDVYDMALSLSFPSAVLKPINQALWPVVFIYLALLFEVNRIEKASKNSCYLSLFPFDLLTEEEIDALEDRGEYRRFKECFENDFVYEMMKLNFEVTGHSTIEHIVGVHYLALFIGRQMKSKGISIDLGRVSGAAAGHDIGKFGVRPEEIKRVAYYHYFYTNQWFVHRDLEHIRNIAVNHSTWDLELEHLSLESLVMIYADFRVKRHKDPKIAHAMKFYSLKEAFDVVLKKLDNVDVSKENRYQKVFLKLDDFQHFLIEQGIQVDPYKKPTSKKKDSTHHLILQPTAVMLRALRSQSIALNIGMMYRLRNDLSLNVVLQLARSTAESAGVRHYIDIFSEYNRYLTLTQKEAVLGFLYELLLHPEEDIRRESAELMGRIMATLDIPYSKEIPTSIQDVQRGEKWYVILNQYLFLYLFPEHHISIRKQEWLSQSYKWMILSLLYYKKDISSEHLWSVLKVLKQDKQAHASTLLLMILNKLPLVRVVVIPLESLQEIIDEGLEGSGVQQLEAVALYKRLKDHSFGHDGLRVRMFIHAESYQDTIEKIMDKPFFYSRLSMMRHIEEYIQNLYVMNLKNVVPIRVKKSNLEILLYLLKSKSEADYFNFAIHLSNLLKVSEEIELREYAGYVLLSISKNLSKTQRNEIVIELVRGLEMERYAFTGLIPTFLGALLVDLSQSDQNEVLLDFKERLQTANNTTKALILRTLGNWLKASYDERKTPSEVHIRKEQILGMLCMGLVERDDKTHWIAFSVLTRDVLCSKHIENKDKADLLSKMLKKIVAWIEEMQLESMIEPFYMAASMNRLYRFIHTCTHEEIQIEPAVLPKAYFSGTFDPFSLGQSAVVEALIQSGYEVYLAIEEFNWMRKTEPHMHRRRIVELAIAQALNAYLFPRELLINLSNEKGLKALKKAFSHHEVYLVMGEDLLLSHPAYSDTLNIYQLPHLIIRRGKLTQHKKQQVESVLALLDHYEVIQLDHAQEIITPDHIRKSLDRKWGISDLIDPLVEAYVLKHKLYRDVSQFKQNLIFSQVRVIVESFETVDSLKKYYHNKGFKYPAHLTTVVTSEIQALTYMMIQNSDKEILASALAVTEKREGKGYCCQVIDFDVKVHEGHFDYGWTLLTEISISALQKGMETIDIIFKDKDYGHKEAMRVMGFNEQRSGIYTLPIKNPIVLFLDVQSALRPEYRTGESFRKTLYKTRVELIEALRERHPHQGILIFDRGMLYAKVLRHIEALRIEKMVPILCVPYGDLLKRWLIPGVITKAIHTERYYQSDLIHYRVDKEMGYLSLPEQSAVLKAFDSPVVLIDDLLDKGKRLMHLKRHFDKEGFEQLNVVVGVLTDEGKHVSDKLNYTVYGGYELPEIDGWLNESVLYPFIGGDAIDQGRQLPVSPLPSINRILPYAKQRTLRKSKKKSHKELSEVALSNSILLMKALEAMYLDKKKRLLTLRDVSEVFLKPKCPYTGKWITYDTLISPSQHIEQALMHYKRMEK